LNYGCVEERDVIKFLVNGSRCFGAALAHCQNVGRHISKDDIVYSYSLENTLNIVIISNTIS
jgi:hypothetical protein